ELGEIGFRPVHRRDFPALPHQLLDQVEADEACRAGHERALHLRAPLRLCCGSRRTVLRGRIHPPAVWFVKSRFGVPAGSANDHAPKTSRWLVSTEWLAARLRDPDVVVVDGSYHLPTAKRDPRAEYRAAHIPGAVFFDIEEIADHSSDLPHMLPSAEAFAEAAGSLGISDLTKIVVYDSQGLFSAARVWWTFRVFGAAHVFILDGGLPKWIAEGRPVESGEVVREPHKFTARKNGQAIKAAADVQQALRGGATQIVDARSAQRFRGEGPEPRP